MHPVVHLAARGHDDHRHVADRADLAAQHHAVDVGKPQVEEDHVDVVDPVEHTCPGRQPLHGEPAADQRGHERPGDPVVVFHQQHAHACSSPVIQTTVAGL